MSVLYDAEAGTINCLTEHTDTVSASDFSIDGELIITASYDKNIIVRALSSTPNLAPPMEYRDVVLLRRTRTKADFLF